MIPASHHGRFAGPNRLWFMPGTPAHVPDGALLVVADRAFVRWAHEDVPKQGKRSFGIFNVLSDGREALAMNLRGARAG